MHYGIIGIGPVGATFAALLHASGHRVSVLDNNADLVALVKSRPIKIKGFYKVKTELTEFYTNFEEFAAADPDVVLISVKTYALQFILPLIKASSLKEKPIVSCQNGIDSEKEIAEAVGAEHAFRMVLNFGVGYSPANAVTVHFLNEPHYFSCVSPSQKDTACKIIDDLRAAGMKVEFVDDITRESFTKAILNTCLSTVCTLTRTTMSEALGDSDLKWTVSEIIREGIAICKAYDIDLGADFLDKAMAYLSKGGNHKPSMLVDVENARRTEIHYLAGKLFQHAQRRSVPAPVTHSMYCLVKGLENSEMVRQHELTAAK